MSIKLINDVQVQLINTRIMQFVFIDFHICKYEAGELIIGCGASLVYYHEFEIRFKSVFAMECKWEWSVDTKVQMLEVLEGTEEARQINLKYGVVIGNTVFRINTEDQEVFYVVAEEVELVENVVKYYA